MIRLLEKICVLGKLHLGMGYTAFGCESINQQHILNKASLNRKTHKTKLYIDWLTKM